MARALLRHSITSGPPPRAHVPPCHPDPGAPCGSSGPAGQGRPAAGAPRLGTGDRWREVGVEAGPRHVTLAPCRPRRPSPTGTRERLESDMTPAALMGLHEARVTLSDDYTTAFLLHVSPSVLRTRRETSCSKPLAGGPRLPSRTRRGDGRRPGPFQRWSPEPGRPLWLQGAGSGGSHRGEGICPVMSCERWTCVPHTDCALGPWGDPWEGEAEGATETTRERAERRAGVGGGLGGGVGAAVCGAVAGCAGPLREDVTKTSGSGVAPARPTWWGASRRRGPHNATGSWGT